MKVLYFNYYIGKVLFKYIINKKVLFIIISTQKKKTIYKRIYMLLYLGIF